MTEGNTIADVLEGRADWVVVTGDALEVLPTIPAGSVGAVICDPPYGIGLKHKQHKWFKQDGTGYAGFDDTPESVLAVALPAVEEARRLASAVAVTPGPALMFRYPEPDGFGVAFNPAGAGIGPWGFQCAQPMLFYGRCPYTKRGLGNRPTSVQQSPSDFSDKNGHPCPKPLGWMTWLVTRVSIEGDVILDPFCGSGTTGVAAIKTGRRFIGIEIDEHWADIARRRIREAEPVLFTRSREEQAEMFQ